MFPLAALEPLGKEVTAVLVAAQITMLVVAAVEKAVLAQMGRKLLAATVAQVRHHLFPAPL
jgi:hypothetical protein